MTFVQLLKKLPVGISGHVIIKSPDIKNTICSGNLNFDRPIIPRKCLNNKKLTSKNTKIKKEAPIMPVSAKS